jgi:transposase
MGEEIITRSDWKQWRRLQAWRLSRRGWRQHDIAEALGVSKGAVSQWLAKGRASGKTALMTKSGRGRPPRLAPEQVRLIPDFLGHGAEAYGFRGELWTTARITKVIAEEFQISFHRAHVSRLLKQLHWTPQLPVRRAQQRDEREIQRWREEVWPELKVRAVRQRRSLVFTDESGFYLLPGLVKTYAPKGNSPVIREKWTRDHLSIMGGLTLDAKLYSLVRQKSLNSIHTVEFLRHLMRYLGPRLLVIWDGSPIHRWGEVRDFLASREGRGIQVEPLPPYAPDLNPIEAAWQHLKHVELRNVVCLDLEELHLQFHAALARLRQKTRIIRSFFQEAGLPL